jgi:CRISPR-associated protein Csb2
MPLIELSFPAGRFHATPWGRHVNEGAVEWPPSPWRILRALIATWYLKGKDTVSEEVLRSLIVALASKLPRYSLPKASLGHTRHYMPYNEGKNTKTTKVFDTFIQLPAGEAIRVLWDVELDSDQQNALEYLVSRLSYFGRAESLVQGQVRNGNGTVAEVRPLADSEALANDEEIVRLIVPLSNDEYLAWRAEYLAGSAAPAASRAKGKKSQKSGFELPSDIPAALLADTGELQAAGWTIPPGATYVNYARSARCFDIAPIQRTKRNAFPTVARFAVVSQVMPRMTQAVSVAERIHQSLVKWSGNSPVFTGRQIQGEPMVGHDHAHVFCESYSQRDAITHVTVFARMGFDAAAGRALKQLRTVWGHGGHDLQLVLLGVGNIESFGDALPLQKANVWESASPFVPTRHPKCYRDGRPKLDEDGWPIGSPAHDLRRLIRETGFPMPAKIEALSRIRTGKRFLRCIEFQAIRRHGNGSRAGQFGHAFRVTFAEPVQGPLAFGYAAHFGLGLFVPVDARSSHD